LLPEVISGVMDSVTDNECPHWDTATHAKEIIVYLTRALGSWDEVNRTGLANARKFDPEAVAGMVRHIQEVEPHLRALAACRDIIAQQLGMGRATVERMTEYNTLTAAENSMFSDLRNNFSGQPNYFAKLVTMPDQRKALHLIDLELRYLDFSISRSAARLANDAGNASEDLDRRTLVSDTQFRKALVVVRAKIVKQFASVAPR
jgi:hypothetical protein